MEENKFMEISSTELSCLLCVKLKKRDFSRMTAVWNCGSLPPSDVVGKKLIAEEMRAEGILSKSGRRCAPPHIVCPSTVLFPKSLLGNENVAISTHICAMFILHLPPFHSRKSSSVSQPSWDRLSSLISNVADGFFISNLGNRYIYVTCSTSVWLVRKKG